MSDYIDRQAALDAVIKHLQLDYEYAWGVRESINSLPAADVVPVVHGRWNQLDNGGFVCSACMGGYKAQPTRMGKPMFEYCPICGAKMHGGESDG